MKKTFLAASLCCMALSSCTNENMQLTSLENQKSEATENFKKALVSLNSRENLSTEEEKRAPGYPEMNERKLNLLYPAAKGMIQATGVQEAELLKATDGDKKAAVQWALEILRDNNTTTSL